MTVLDATRLESETDLAGEDTALETEAEAVPQAEPQAAADPIDADFDHPFHFANVRTLTIPLPPETETAITLLIEQGDDHLYRGAYKIRRAYNCSPHETENELVPFAEVAEEDAMPELGEVIANTADSAAWWLSQHTDDTDDKGQAVMDELGLWFDRFDKEAANNLDVAFDPLASEPVVSSEQEPTPEPTPTPPPARTMTPDEAQKHFDERKAAFAWAIADGHMQLADAKARVKSLTKAIEFSVEQLEEMIERGPEVLPLFDKPQEEAATEAEPPLFAGSVSAEGEILDGATPLPPAVSQPAADPDAWREVAIHALEVPKAIKAALVEDNQIATLGQLADYCKEYALTDLKKIGTTKAAKIEEALEKYWAEHPQA